MNALRYTAVSGHPLVLTPPMPRILLEESYTTPAQDLTTYDVTLCCTETVLPIGGNSFDDPAYLGVGRRRYPSKHCFDFSPVLSDVPIEIG